MVQLKIGDIVEIVGNHPYKGTCGTIKDMIGNDQFILETMQEHPDGTITKCTIYAWEVKQVSSNTSKTLKISEILDKQ